VFHRDGYLAASYQLVRAWPSKMEVSGVNAAEGRMLVETVTLLAEEVQR
jgi:hypothetical protein